MTYLGVAALAVAAVSLLGTYLALRTLARLRRETATVLRAMTGGDAVLGSGRSAVPGGAVPGGAVPGGLGNVALVRFDAFGEMSGRMSFALALLDAGGDGVTISALAGPTDTRVYAKAVLAGRGESQLSPEERQAVSAALERRSASTPTRRWRGRRGFTRSSADRGRTERRAGHTGHAGTARAASEPASRMNA